MGVVHLCRCTPVFRISGTSGRIVLKFGMWIGPRDHLAERFTQVKSGVNLYVRMCILLSVSSEWLVDCAEILYLHMWVEGAHKLIAMRATQAIDRLGYLHLVVRTCKYSVSPCLGDGWTHYAEIWCAVMDQLAMHFIHAKSGAHLHVVAVVNSFLHLETYWTHHAELWFVIRPN